MATLKHVGRLITNQKKCCVVYRVLPGDPNTALVVLTQSLDASEHDALISLVDSATAQDSDELGEAMARAQLPDGRNMLAGFHKTGKLLKVATDQIEMTPNNTTTVVLSVLNNAIAELKKKEIKITVNDLAIKDAQGNTVPEVKESKDAVVDATDVYTNQTDGVLSDADLAKSYRSQADRLSKEAAQLRRQAEELVPTKKTAKTKESA